VALRRAGGFRVQTGAEAAIGAGMGSWIIAAAVATIVITGGLTYLVYRVNAPPEQRRRKADGDGGSIYVGGDGARGRADADRSDDGVDGGGGGDGGGD